TPDVPRTASITEFIDNYFRGGWHKRDIRAARGVPRVQSGEPVVIARDSAYNECYIPNRYRWRAAVGFWSASTLWGLSVQRDEGSFRRQRQANTCAIISAAHRGC